MPGSIASTPELSRRERLVAARLLEGLSNPQIAEALHMKERTVKATFNRMFQKYGIRGGIKRIKLAVALYRQEQSTHERKLGNQPDRTL